MRIVGCENRHDYSDSLHDEPEIIAQQMGECSHFPIDAHLLKLSPPKILEHSFQYFRRTQLQEMSVDGKVRALSKLLRDNFGFVMQGVGVVVPIFATYDGNSKPEARLY